MRALSFFRVNISKRTLNASARLAEHRDSVGNLLVGILYGR